MKIIAIVALLHGAIHLFGFGKAFGFFDAPQLRSAISKPLGVLWLAAAILLIAMGALSFRLSYRPPWESLGGTWFALTVCAIVLSQALIFTSWRDAKFGTIANVILLLPLVFETLELRSSSFRSAYAREIAAAASAPNTVEDGIVTEHDIATLPTSLQRYLRRTGAIGQPRVNEIHVRWRGEMRRTPTSGWISVEADQYERFDAFPSPSRYFLLYASQYGLPFQSFHRYVGDSATMNVRVLSVFDVVDARGEKMNQSETVTLFNDMCVLAPSTLIDATLVKKSVTWNAIDDRHLHGTFRNAGYTISADLVFNEEGDLIDFISENSRFLSPDGKIYEQYPWSTPIHEYRNYGGGYRVASRADALWKRPTGDYTYARFVIADITLNEGKKPVPSTTTPARDRLSFANVTVP